MICGHGPSSNHYGAVRGCLGDYCSERREAGRAAHVKWMAKARREGGESWAKVWATRVANAVRRHEDRQLFMSYDDFWFSWPINARLTISPATPYQSRASVEDKRHARAGSCVDSDCLCRNPEKALEFWKNTGRGEKPPSKRRRSKPPKKTRSGRRQSSLFSLPGVFAWRSA